MERPTLVLPEMALFGVCVAVLNHWIERNTRLPIRWFSRILYLGEPELGVRKV